MSKLASQSAFPGISDTYCASDGYNNFFTGVNAYGGMDLRTYTAIEMQKALLANPVLVGDVALKYEHQLGERWVQKVAIIQADALLAELEK